MTRRRKIDPATLPQDRVSVNVLTHKRFARACVEAWRRTDGRDRSYMMGYVSIDVPAEVVAQARADLNAKRANTND